MKAITSIYLLLLASLAESSELEYAQRLQFSAKLLTVMQTKPDQQLVESILGKPSRKLFVQKAGVNEAWHYSSNKAGAFPDLGSVYFNSNGEIVHVFGAAPSQPSLRKVSKPIATYLRMIGESPGMYAHSFDSLTAVDNCRKLAKLPFDDVIAVMEEYLRVRPLIEDSFGASLALGESEAGNDGRLGILLLILLADDPSVSPRIYLDTNCLLYIKSSFAKETLPGQLVFRNNWPIVLLSGHIPCGGRSEEQELLNYARQKGSFAFRAPTSNKPELSTYKEFSKFFQHVCASDQVRLEYLKNTRRQLGLGTTPELSMP